MKDYNEHTEKLFANYLQNMLPKTNEELRKYESDHWERSIPVKHQPTSSEQHYKNFKKYNSDWRISACITKMFWGAYAILVAFFAAVLVFDNAEYDNATETFVINIAKGSLKSVAAFLGVVILIVILATYILHKQMREDWQKFYNKLPIHIYHIWYIDDYDTSNGHQVRRPDTYQESANETQ